MSQLACTWYRNLLQNQVVIWWLVLTPALLVFVSCVWLTAKITRTTHSLGLLILGSTATLLLTLATWVITFIGLVVLDEANQPVASRYFSLNAAIKNTCYLDPHNQHCPHSVDQLIQIEPARFTQLLSGKKVAYVFDSATENYSLLIQHNQKRGVLFDPKLSQELGHYDFVDLQFSCDPTSPPTPLYLTHGPARILIQHYIDTIWPILKPTRL